MKIEMDGALSWMAGRNRYGHGVCCADTHGFDPWPGDFARKRKRGPRCGEPHSTLKPGEIAFTVGMMGNIYGRVLSVRNGSKDGDWRWDSPYQDGVELLVIAGRDSTGFYPRECKPNFYLFGHGWSFYRIADPNLLNQYLEVEATMVLTPYQFLLKRINEISASQTQPFPVSCR